MSSPAELSSMTSQRRHSRSTDKYPPGGPAEWLADGHVTCSIQCSGGKCDRRMLDVRLDTLPQNLPWSTIGRRLVCKECGVTGSVNIVPIGMTERHIPCHSPSIGNDENPLVKLTAAAFYARNPRKPVFFAVCHDFRLNLAPFCKVICVEPSPQSAPPTAP